MSKKEQRSEMLEKLKAQGVNVEPFLQEEKRGEHPGLMIRRNYMARYRLETTSLARHIEVNSTRFAGWLSGHGVLSAPEVMRLASALGISFTPLFLQQSFYLMAKARKVVDKDSLPEALELVERKKSKSEDF